MKKIGSVLVARLLLLICLIILIGTDLRSQAIAVSIEQDDNGNWMLYRDGKPYPVNGVGGSENLEKAISIGANSFRTWSTDNADELLDKAQSLGLTVLMGLWMQHERHGFDYNNREKVEQQLNYFRQTVEKYKDHPALLAWGVGNEVDLFYTNTNVWYAVNDVATMIHQIDPNHPTMTVTAGLDTAEVRLIMERAPAIDIYGINTYGDLGSVYDKIRTTKWDKPYMITEWGPNGHWEVSKTSWGAAIEQNSTEKATSYKERYIKYIMRDTQRCIGSYVFLWGQKQETTSTWYGLFNENGLSSPAVDELERIWTLKEPLNVAPIIISVKLNGWQKGDSILLKPFSNSNASAIASDGDNDKLRYHWEVVSESQDIKSGGDAESKPPSMKGLSMRIKKNTLKFKAPDAEGAYRLFLFIYDNKGHYAYENIPFYVLPPTAEDKSGQAVSFKKRTL